MNCAGVLQDSASEDTHQVHSAGAAALFCACEQVAIRKVIHFSAIGVDREQPSAFSASKLAGDESLMERDLEWVILRPSVVLGRPAFGASALFRGLAALPVMPATGPLQVVRLDDVVATVIFMLRPKSPSRMALELAGPEALAMAEIVELYRRWLGWKPARKIALPVWAGVDPLSVRRSCRMARLASSDPHQRGARNRARRHRRSATVDHDDRNTPEESIFRTGCRSSNRAGTVVRRSLFSKAGNLPCASHLLDNDRHRLAHHGLAERRRYPDRHRRRRVGPLDRGGRSGRGRNHWYNVAWRPASQTGLWGAIATSLFYAIAGTVLRPDLWNEPLGPLMKILPILALHFVALAVLEER